MVLDMRQHMVQDCAQPLTLHQVVVLGRKTGLAPFPAFPHCKAAVPRWADRLAEHPMHLVMHLVTHLVTSMNHREAQYTSSCLYMRI